MSKNFKYGFTLAEIVTALTVIGVIFAIALAATIRQDKVKTKQISAMTKSFYANVDNAYNQILGYKAANGVITGLEDSNGDNNIDSTDLRGHFNYYMDGDDIDCSKIGFNINSGSTVANYYKDAICSTHGGNIIAGYYLNKACNSTITAKETYIEDEMATRSVSNACGYVVYGLKGSKGNIGVDVFVIPLGKIGLK